MLLRFASISVTAAVCGVVHAGPTFPAWPQVGRHLTRQLDVAQIDTTPRVYQHDVICNGAEIGEIQVQYGLFQAAKRRNSVSDPVGPVVGFGAYCRFAFTRNSINCCPPPLFEPPGVEYRWLQIVNTNTAGSRTPVLNQWFLDYDRQAANAGPFYATGRRDIGRWGFTAATDDIAFRPMPAAPDYVHWSAVSILVCVYQNEMHVLDAFSWGFDIFPGAGDLRPSAPQRSGPLSAQMMAAIRADPSMQGWWIYEEGCCCIPAPSAASALSLLGLAAMRRRRAA